MHSTILARHTGYSAAIKSIGCQVYSHQKGMPLGLTSAVSPRCGSITSCAGVKCSVMLITGPLTGSAWYGATASSFWSLKALLGMLKRSAGLSDTSPSAPLALLLSILSTGTGRLSSHARETGSDTLGCLSDMVRDVWISLLRFAVSSAPIKVAMMQEEDGRAGWHNLGSATQSARWQE